MTEELKPGATAQTPDPVVASADNSHIEDPAERAKANGYVDPAPPSKQERVKAMVKYVEHAHQHNSPISRHMIAEMKDLLGFEELLDEAHPQPQADAAA